ncbi:MAG: helical backbone metal receptor [Vicinamibacterales bacterium]
MRPVPIFLLLAACSSPPQPPQTQTAAEPQRIVSLIPAVTETLFAVGAGPRVVGVGTYDAYPPEVKGLTRVGGLIDPDTERILALKPDLAFLYGSQEDLMRQLSAAGIAIEQYRHGGLADVIASIRAIGKRVGRAAQGEQIASGIDRAIDEVRTRAQAKPHPKVLVVFGREEGTLRGIYASGGIGFIHDLLTAAGGRNVFEDIRRESVQASLESILERSPEVILEIRAGPRGPHWPEQQAAAWSAAPSLPAVRNKRLHVLIDERLVVPGPRIAEGLQLIEQALWK